MAAWKMKTRTRRRAEDSPPKTRKADRSETMNLYAPHRRFMMECFAREVIAAGYGARGPTNLGSARFPKYETLQETGRRLFGPDFTEVLRQELAKQNMPPGGASHAQALPGDQGISPKRSSGNEDERSKDARGQDIRSNAQAEGNAPIDGEVD